MLFSSGRVLSAASSLTFCAAAGLARLEDVRASIQLSWDSQASMEEEPYIHSGFFDWEREFYPPFLKGDDRVLVIGCGTGRDLLALLEQGFRAEGLDCGPRVTEIARRVLAQRGLTAPVVTGPIETTPLSGLFDAVIFSWFCYCYIPGAASRVAVLAKVKGHLGPGGRILISYIPFEPSRRHQLLTVTRLVARLSGSDWRPEPGDLVVHDRAGRYLSHFEHQFTEAEIEGEARAAGLSVASHQRGHEGRLVLMA